MVEESTAYSDEEFAELLGFLQDPKLEVQRFAAEGVLAQTESPHFLEYCRRQPRKAARLLLRLAEKAEADSATSGAVASLAAGSARTPEQMKAARAAAMEALAASSAGASALQALVNISAVPTVRDELVELSAPRRAADAMRGGWLEGRSGLAHWHAMLLSNLTTVKIGQEALCADEVTLRFLLAAYTSKPRPKPRDGYEDPLIWLGKVIGNCFALEAGRRLLATGEQGAGTVAALVGELGDRQRRLDIVSALRNLALDEQCHTALLAASPLPSFAKFLYPWDKVPAEQRRDLGADLEAGLAADGAALTADAPVRLASAVCLLGLCTSREGREHLRAEGAPELARAWLEEEGEQEVRNALQAVLPAIARSEEELAAQQAQGGEGALADVQSAADAAVAARAADAAGGAAPPAAEVRSATASQVAMPTDDVLRVKASSGPLPQRDEALKDGDMVGLFDHIEGVETSAAA